jgi:hypothetical protein
MQVKKGQDELLLRPVYHNFMKFSVPSWQRNELRESCTRNVLGGIPPQHWIGNLSDQFHRGRSRLVRVSRKSRRSKCQFVHRKFGQEFFFRCQSVFVAVLFQIRSGTFHQYVPFAVMAVRDSYYPH